MANIDKVSVKNTVYNIVSPAVVSDYIEVIGGACTKPDGYVEDEVILAKQNDVQLLFKATQDIAFGANIVENTNCVRTTLEEVLKNAGGGGGASSADQVSYDNSDSGLGAENVQEAVDELATNAGTASSQIQTLTNNLADEVSARATLGAHNLLPNSILIGSWGGLSFTNNSDGSFTVSGTASENVFVSISPIFTLKKGTYILHGGAIPSGSEIAINDKDGNRVADDYSGNVSFTLSQDTEVYVFFYAVGGIVIPSTTIYPMIRLASDTDDTYQPYSMTNREMTPYVQAISNPNLLDNPWFTVNQRVFTSDANPSAGTHLVDRWAVRYNPSTGSVAVNDGIVTLTSADKILIVGERFEKSVGFSGKMLTASIMLSDGTILSGTGIFPNENGADVNVIDTSDLTVYYQYSSASGGYPFLGITCKANKTLAIKAVKLELGSVSTLAQDTAPNYQQELAKCQRYFYRHKGAYEYVGYFNTATNFRANLALPVPMRAIPSMTLETPTDYAQCAIYDAQGSLVQPSAIAVDTVNSIVGQPEILLNSTVATHTQNICGVQRFNLQMDLSADL